MPNMIWTDRPLVINEGEINVVRAELAAWEQAVYPIGNGRLGAAAFGAPRCERIQFNQNSLWVGNEDNTDAYFGFAAAVNELLVQSNAGCIHLLPALPAAWPDGEVKGMRVRGGYALDMAWKDGKLSSATLHGLSNTEQPCEVRYGETRQTLAVKRGESRGV